MLMLLLVVVLSLGLGDAAEGATTYIDGDWYIYGDTTLSDGTWSVNGSVIVENGTLTLDRVELVLNRTGFSISRLSIGTEAHLVTRNSEIWGNSTGITIDISGDTMFDNTSIHNFIMSSSYGGIDHVQGSLTLDHCQLDMAYYMIMSRGNLNVRSCQFTNFYQYGIYWISNPGGPGYTVVVADSSFINDFYTQRGYGIGIIQQGVTDDDNQVSVIGCDFDGLSYAMVFNNFETYGKLLVEDNRAINCSYGVNMAYIGPVGTFTGNHWEATASGTAMYIEPSDSGSPNINNETIIGGNYGLYISGSYGRVALRDMDVTGVSTGLYTYSGYIDVYDSTFRSSGYNFRISRGYIHLYDCSHQYYASVSSYNGEVSEPVIINFTQISWQDGTVIEEGFTQFENETGEYMTERNNEWPFPVPLATWMRTYRDNITILKVRGMYYKDGLEFRSEPFGIVGVSRMELVIIDNSTPEVEVTQPRAEDKFEAISLTFKGNFTERGVGMGRIRMTYNGTGWLSATLFDEGKWQLRFRDLPDGILTFTVNISDRAGNSMEIHIPNITIDTIWPHITVKLPGKYVTSTPTQLLAQTEPRARAFVNYNEVDVMPDGWFSSLIPLYNSVNEVHIRVVDVVGHENYTLYRIILDTTDPPLIVETPTDGRWTNRETVLVTGTTEADTTVEANGIQGELEYGRFTISVPLEEGINLVTVTAIDLAGNEARVVLVIHHDSVPPELLVTSPENGTITALTRVMISGSVVEDNPVLVLVNNLSADVVEGKWSRDVPVEDGDNIITVVAIDLAGNTVSRQILVITDREMPIVKARLKSDATTYIPYEGSWTTKETSIDLEVEMNERVFLKIMGGSELARGPGKHTETLFLEPGLNDIAILARDMAGNPGATITFRVIHDVAAPDLTVDVEDDLVRTKVPRYTMKGTTEPGCQVTVNDIPVPVLDNGTFACVVHLEAGPNTVRTVAIDPAGNVASQTIQVVYDEEEDDAGGVTGWPSIIIGTIFGFLAGLIAAIAVTRRGKTVPPPEEPPLRPPTKVVQPSEATREAPGQVTPEPQVDKNEWEML
jgi:hypothetical protein